MKLTSSTYILNHCIISLLICAHLVKSITFNRQGAAIPPLDADLFRLPFLLPPATPFMLTKEDVDAAPDAEEYAEYLAEEDPNEDVDADADADADE